MKDCFIDCFLAKIASSCSWPFSLKIFDTCQLMKNVRDNEGFFENAVAAGDAFNGTIKPYEIKTFKVRLK